MLISYGLFVFKYPYTCSSDFRYMAACLVFTSIGFVCATDKAENGNLGKMLAIVTTMSITLTLCGSLVVYMFWEIS